MKLEEKSENYKKKKTDVMEFFVVHEFIFSYEWNRFLFSLTNCFLLDYAALISIIGKL